MPFGLLLPSANQGICVTILWDSVTMHRYYLFLLTVGHNVLQINHFLSNNYAVGVKQKDFTQRAQSRRKNRKEKSRSLAMKYPVRV
jgi:hypothetical protein